MPQRQYTKEPSKVAKGNPRVILPISLDEYQEKMSDAKQFRHWLDRMVAEYPRLFPAEIEQGYRLHDTLPASSKLPNVCFRRIKLKAANEAGRQQVLTIGMISCPSVPGPKSENAPSRLHTNSIASSITKTGFTTSVISTSSTGLCTYHRKC